MEKHPKAPANNKRLYGQNAAVALKYNPDMNYAPVVVASGLGELAQRIVNIADEAGVPVYRDDSVAALLVMLNAGENHSEGVVSDSRGDIRRGRLHCQRHEKEIN